MGSATGRGKCPTNHFEFSYYAYACCIERIRFEMSLPTPEINQANLPAGRVGAFSHKSFSDAISAFK